MSVNALCRNVAVALLSAAAVLAPSSAAVAVASPASMTQQAAAESSRPDVQLKRVDWRNRTYQTTEFGAVQMRKGRAALDDVTAASIKTVRHGKFQGAATTLVAYHVVDVPTLHGADNKPAYAVLHLFQVREGRVVQVAAGTLEDVDPRGQWRVALKKGQLLYNAGPGATTLSMVVGGGAIAPPLEAD